MATVVTNIWDTFSRTKEGGSYFLFYLLALLLGAALGYTRHEKRMKEDTLPLFPFLFGAVMLILVIANPIAVGLLQRLFPVLGDVTKIWPLLLTSFLIAYGAVCFLETISERKTKKILIVCFAVLIGVAGSFYGLLPAKQPAQSAEKQAQKAALEYLKDLGEGIYLAAPEEVLEYAGVYHPELFSLYGKDLYTPNMDLGIVDGYASELYGVYEGMKNPKECFGDIADIAGLYDCDAIIIKRYEKAPKAQGMYHLLGETDEYLVYTKK